MDIPPLIGQKDISVEMREAGPHPGQIGTLSVQSYFLESAGFRHRIKQQTRKPPLL
jgi:hypothetical protein